MADPQSTLPRIFMIGTTRITEDDTTYPMTNEEVQIFLKPQYPEIALATIEEWTDEDTQTHIINFKIIPGRKG